MCEISVPAEGSRLMDLSDMQLIRLQVESLFTHDARGRICFVREPGGDRAPRFFLGRTREGNLWRCREDLAEETVRELEGLASDEPVRDDLRTPPRNLGAFLAALGPYAGSQPASWGPAYRFPDRLVLPAKVTRLARVDLHLLELMGWGPDESTEGFEAREPYMAVIEDGAAVSLCRSARLTAQAAEAGVDTVEAYRGRGYASAVVAAWAHAIRAGGRIPLYSTSWDNPASQAVARRLGLVQYGTDLSLG